jgi:aminoglycoside N3'-acetyltransferase
MRKVKVKFTEGEKDGVFHCWGNVTEYNNDTNSSFPALIAAVEMADGKVITVEPEAIRFVDAKDLIRELEEALATTERAYREQKERAEQIADYTRGYQNALCSDCRSNYED